MAGRGGDCCDAGVRVTGRFAAATVKLPMCKWAWIDSGPEESGSPPRSMAAVRRFARSKERDDAASDACELCGSQDSVEVHHLRRLADLQRHGRCEKPRWVKVMVARHRETLVVCDSCHGDIHAGAHASSRRSS
jgi:hypothetical protein